MKYLGDLKVRKNAKGLYYFDIGSEECWSNLIECARKNHEFKPRRGLSSKKIRVQKRVVRNFLNYLLRKYLNDNRDFKARNDK